MYTITFQRSVKTVLRNGTVVYTWYRHLSFKSKCVHGKDDITVQLYSKCLLSVTLSPYCENCGEIYNTVVYVHMIHFLHIHALSHSTIL